MPTHNEHEHEPEKVDASAGYERADVGVTGILVFLTALTVFVVVAAVLCYGIGKVYNLTLNKEDGPTSKWAKTADVRDLGNLPTNPQLQSKVAELTQQFPAPRVQVDDGNQDVADLHEREDLLLEHYSKVDGTDKVRIPIELAMELIAKKGLPVASATATEKPLTGDSVPTVTAPLTTGFARTAFEQEAAARKKIESVQAEKQ